MVASGIEKQGQFASRNSNSSDPNTVAILAELKSLRAEVSELRKTSDRNAAKARSSARDLQRLLLLKIRGLTQGKKKDPALEQAIAALGDRIASKVETTKEDLEGLFVQLIALLMLGTTMGISTAGLIGVKKAAEIIPGQQWFEAKQEQVQQSTKTSSWQTLFEGGSNSPVAIAVGNAEGTRTPDGGKTAAFSSHSDPGNGVTNLGTFSYQHGASSPEEADQKQLTRLKGQLEAIAPDLIKQGADVRTWLNAADLLNQSPAAGKNFPKYLKECNGDVLCARTKSYEGDAPGITRNGITIAQDQRRRMDAIAKAIAANPDKFKLSSPVAASGQGQAIADAAKKWVGKEFNPGVTAQCAYFVREVLESVGIKPEVTRSPLDGKTPVNLGHANSFYGEDVGTLIKDPSQLQPGDVVMFLNTYGNFPEGTVTHVGIYVGNGEMVDRPTAAKPVQQRSISTFRFAAGLRLVSAGDGAIASSAPAGEAQAYFDSLKGFEFGGAGFSPRKSAKIQVIGSPTLEDTATLQQVIADLNALGGSYQIVGDGGDVKVHFADINTFSQIDPLYKPGNIGFFSSNGNVLIASGSPVVPVTGKPLTQQERSHLIREEVTQLLTGLGKDSTKYQDSIFQQSWTATQQFSALDKEVIRMALK